MKRPAILPSVGMLEQVKAMPDASWGPAMAALSPRLRCYVIARIQFQLDSREAARAAGSRSITVEALDVTASRWAHTPGVAEAMREELDRTMLDSAPEMLRIVEGLARNTEGKVKPETQLKAASGLLDRAGLAAAQRIEVSHEHQHTVTLTNEQLQADLERMLGKPLSPEALAALPPPPADREIVDVEFEEITEDPFAWTPTDGAQT